MTKVEVTIIVLYILTIMTAIASIVITLMWDFEVGIVIAIVGIIWAILFNAIITGNKK